MGVFFFEGSTVPDTIPLTIDYRPRLLRRETPDDPNVDFEVTVWIGRIRVRVEIEGDVTEETAHELFIPAWDLARTLVETAGYVRAIPYSVSLERAVFENGKVMAIALGDRKLAATHSFEDADIERLSDLFLVDLPASLALGDLLMTLGKSHYSPIACGRVADSLARLISPKEERKRAWANLRTALRVDEAFLRLLSDISTPSRHGDRKTIDAQTNQETARRAWILMNRYLRYRLGGPLPEDKYPVLSDAGITP